MHRCSVCLGEYKEGELLRFLPQCAHNFHRTCIDAWLQQHATCPVCRMSLQGYFVGRLMAPLQLSPALTEHGSWTPSLQSDAGSLGSFPSRAVGILEDTSACDEPPALVSVPGSHVAPQSLGAQTSVSSSRVVSDRPSQCDINQGLVERPLEFRTQSSVTSFQVVLEGLDPCGINQACTEQRPPNFQISPSLLSLQEVAEGPYPRDINQASIERATDFRVVDVGIAPDMRISHFVERG